MFIALHKGLGYYDTKFKKLAWDQNTKYIAQWFMNNDYIHQM